MERGRGEDFWRAELEGRGYVFVTRRVVVCGMLLERFWFEGLAGCTVMG